MSRQDYELEERGRERSEGYTVRLHIYDMVSLSASHTDGELNLQKPVNNRKPFVHIPLGMAE